MKLFGNDMSYEIFTNPSLVADVKKFVRVRDIIFLGPVDEGHRDIADHFGIDKEVQKLRRDSRQDVDGGFIEVNNVSLFVEFDNESGTYELNFHQQAREGTVFVAKPKCAGYDVRYRGVNNAEIAVAKTRIKQSILPDFYDRDGDSLYSTR